jgi:hypothetical protein
VECPIERLPIAGKIGLDMSYFLMYYIRNRYICNGYTYGDKEHQND